MNYLVEQKVYVTDKGNKMSEIEIYHQGLDERAIDAAWPVIIQKRSVSNTGDWLATEYEYAERIGKRPTFGEVRTQEMLERLIDLQPSDLDANTRQAEAQ